MIKNSVPKLWGGLVFTFFTFSMFALVMIEVTKLMTNNPLKPFVCLVSLLLSFSVCLKPNVKILYYLFSGSQLLFFGLLFSDNIKMVSNINDSGLVTITIAYSLVTYILPNLLFVFFKINKVGSVIVTVTTILSVIFMLFVMAFYVSGRDLQMYYFCILMFRLTHFILWYKIVVKNITQKTKKKVIETYDKSELAKEIVSNDMTWDDLKELCDFSNITLEELKEMLDYGEITLEEYNKAKADIISKL